MIVKGKAPHKLQLESPNCDVQWYNAKDLLPMPNKPLPKKYQGNMGIVPPEKVEKPEPKPIIAKESLPPKNEIEQEDISDVTYAFKSFRFELRQILRKHGIKTEQKWPNEKILDLVDKNLRQFWGGWF